VRKKRNEGGPAFPCPRYVNANGETFSLSEFDGENGMSLRDYFAAHAPEMPDWFRPATEEQRPNVPEMASAAEHDATMDAWWGRVRLARISAWPWVYADAMLAARERKGGAA
jgi:hypothetical protein